VSLVLLTAVPLIGHLNPLLRQGEGLGTRGRDVLGVLLSVPLSRILTALVGAAFLKGPMTDVFAAIAVLPILIVLSLLSSVPPALKASGMVVCDVLAHY